MDKFKKFDRVIVTRKKHPFYKNPGQISSIYKYGDENGAKFYTVLFGAGNETEYYECKGRELKLLPPLKKSHILTDIFK